MNEDDTFRVLKRRPFGDVFNLYCDFLDDAGQHLTIDEFERKVEEYGWTWKEFNAAYPKYLGR